MNDPDRRHISDGFDHDAIFADIVTHWNDSIAEPEHRTSPSLDDTAAGDLATPEPADPDRTAQDESDRRTQDESDQEAPVDTAPDQSVRDRAAQDKAAQDKAAYYQADADDSADPSPGDAGHLPKNLPPLLPTPGQPPDLPPHDIPAPQVWRSHDVDDDYEEHFEPPPVAPLPVGDLQFWAIIGGMVGGPLLLLFLVFFHREASGYWMLTAIAITIGGFALLVSRLPGHDDQDDNGARL